MNWRPLSLRGVSDPRFDQPSEGIPPWLQRPVVDWIRESFWVGPGYENDEALTALQLAFRMTHPLQAGRLLPSLVERVTRDEEFALDVIDWMLTEWRVLNDHGSEAAQWASPVGEMLRRGGSAWEVIISEDHQTFQLTRRAVGPVAEVLENTAPTASRAHAHLSAAWTKLMGRNPDPSGAYREAVRAAEAVAKPVILPNDDLATLGKMIGVLKKEPEKWSTTLGQVADVRAQMQAVWKGQLDRHGTDDEEVPLNVSQEEADAAFSKCLDLVRQFVGGHVRLASSENDSDTSR